jgi:hypothetical protein
MSAAAAPRNTRERGDFNHSEEQLVKTSLVLWHGAMGAVDATGYLVPALTSTTLKRFCRINLAPERKLDTTGIASGVKTAKMEFGEFQWANSTAGDAIAQADVGNDCYAVDDQTVAKTSGSASRSICGKIMGVDAGGVWVLMNPA